MDQTFFSTQTNVATIQEFRTFLSFGFCQTESIRDIQNIFCLLNRFIVQNIISIFPQCSQHSVKANDQKAEFPKKVIGLNKRETC